MTITITARPSTPFYHLAKGHLFAVVDENAVAVKFQTAADNAFMKLPPTTLEGYEYNEYNHSAYIPNEEDGCVNAVRVIDGMLVYIADEEPVRRLDGKMEFFPA